MRLDGDLAGFGLPGVVTLLASSRATGALVLRRGESAAETGAMWFRDGYVAGACADLARQPLLRRLLAGAVLPDPEVRAALDAAVAGGPGPARRLLDRGVVDPDTVRRAATEATADAVAELLRWAEGAFHVDPGWREPDDVGLVLPADELIEQARARARVWADAAAVIPSPETVLVMPLVPGEDPHLARDEWAALALVDGRRSVAEVVLLSGAGPQRVVPVVAALVRRGLLQARAPGAADPIAEAERRLAEFTLLETGAGTGATRTERPAPTARDARPPSPPSRPAIPLPEPVAAPEPEPTATATASVGAVALAPVVTRDPAVNRSMLLRLIAGVRGL